MLCFTGEVGCYVDALPYLDKACSDRPACKYFVVDQELAETKPCLSNNKPYVELDFVCIEGNICFILKFLSVK